MRAVQLVLLVVLSVISLSAHANSPTKYRVSYKVTEKLPDSFGKVKFYVNGVAGKELKESPKTYKIKSPENPIELSFVAESHPSDHFALTLPAPSSIKQSEYEHFLVELDKFKIAVKVMIYLTKTTAGQLMFLYDIELSDATP